MLKFVVVIGGLMIIFGLCAIIGRANGVTKSWLDEQLGSGWESGFIGFWLGWRLIAFGTVLLYAVWAMRSGHIFSLESIMGTVAIILSVVAMIAKTKPVGQAWFAKKFGDGWRKSLLARFLSWPLFAAGLLMWMPDKIWYDVLKIAGVFIAFWLLSFFQKKSAPADTDASVPGSQPSTPSDSTTAPTSGAI